MKGVDAARAEAALVYGTVCQEWPGCATGPATPQEIEDLTDAVVGPARSVVLEVEVRHLAGGRVGVEEIARRVGCSVSTVRRVLSAVA